MAVDQVIFIKVGDWSRPCKDCGQSPPDVEFGHSAQGHTLNRKSYCRGCCRVRTQQHDAARPDLARARELRRDRDWSADTKRRKLKSGLGPGYFRDRNVRQKFGISGAEYQARFEAQGGCCAICQCHLTLGTAQPSTRATLDHDHVTGRIRDFLCNRCNPLIGMSQERIDVLLRAVEYLRRHTNAEEVNNGCR